MARTRYPAGGMRLGARGPGAWGAAAVTGAAAALLAACSSSTPPQLGVPATMPATTSNTASMMAAGRTRASLDMLTGTTVLTIGTASFGPGGSLLTVTTPAGTVVPQLTGSDPDGTGNGTLVDLSAPGRARSHRHPQR